MSGHMGFSGSIALSSDGHTLASGYTHQMIDIWDIRDTSFGQPLCTLSGHTGPVRTVAFSPDGRILASGSRDTTIKVWDLSNGRLVQTIGQGSIVSIVILGQNNSLLISGCDDGTVKTWIRN
nr:hypothetical protein [Ktedonobacter robiniae]